MQHNESYDLFPSAAVDAWVRAKLADYYKWDNVASMSTPKGAEIPPAALVKFAELAKAWDGTIIQDYGTFYIRKGVPLARQRELAVNAMRDAYQRGEIDMDGKTPEDADS